MNIRLFKPSVGREEINGVKEVINSAWLGLGPKVAEFESEWSKYLKVNSSIGVNSATAALHLAISAFRFPKGKKILVPAITFVSTATAVLYNQLTPVFVDVEAETASMNLKDLEKKWDQDCVAVIPVHNGGYPVPMDTLMDFARQKGLKVIEDCAHCAGGNYNGKKLGTWGDIGCFSFEEKKCMTTGDGGMICSDDADLIAPLRAVRWVGIDKDTWRRAKKFQESDHPDTWHWHYEISVLGYKYNMNDLAAAIGLAQLKKLDKMNAQRARIIGRYLTGIENLRHISPIFPYEPKRYVYWYFGIRSHQRDSLILHLREKGVATGVHFYPLPLHPLFKSFDTGCDTAKKIWKTFITMPSHVDLTNKEVEYVLKALGSFKEGQ